MAALAECFFSLCFKACSIMVSPAGNTRKRWRTHHFCVQHWHRVLALISYTALLLLMPSIQRLIYTLRRSPRRFWSAPRGQGFREREVSFNWKNMREQFADWEEKQYLQHYQVSKGTFWFLCETFGVVLKKEETCLRCSVPFPKRFAILLHWLAQALTQMEHSWRSRSQLDLVTHTTATSASLL